jgi:integrase
MHSIALRNGTDVRIQYTPTPMVGSRSEPLRDNCAKHRSFASEIQSASRGELARIVAEGRGDSLGHAVKAFLAEARIRGVARSTLAAYGCYLERLVYLSVVPAITQDAVLCWLRRLQVDGRKPATIAVARAAAGAFSAYAVERGWMAESPLEDVLRPRIVEPRSRALTRGEAIAVLNACDDEDDRIIVSLFYTTGMRAGELLSLRWADIDFTRQELVVARAGDRVTRRVPLTPSLRNLLLTRASRRLSAVVPIAYPALRQRMLRLGERAGLPFRLRCRDWRQTFASQFLADGGALTELQVLLGHTDLARTRCYGSSGCQDPE